MDSAVENSPRLFDIDTNVFDSYTPAQKDLAAPLDLNHLICYLTAHTVIDYTAVSDFFLTYRLFASPEEVLQILFARFEWAARVHNTKNREGFAVGRDVAVRTFVVIRHWILNYFADDFLPNLDLRQSMAYALNTISLRPEITDSVHLTHIMKQLKRSWLAELALYWDVHTPNGEPAENLPVFAGGPHGIEVCPQSIGQRRLTLLSFYKGPIEPIAMAVDTKQHGSLLKGGILVDNDVEVARIKVSPMKAAASTRRHFFRKRHEPPPAQDIILEDKVDVLALHVVKDLNAMLKWRASRSIVRDRSFISHISQARVSDSTLSRFRPSFASAASTVRQPKREVTSDTLDIATGLVSTSSESDDDDRHHEKEQPAELIDEHNEADAINLRRSAACWDGVGGLQSMDIERVSYNGSLSTLSTLSRPSAGSYVAGHKPFSYEKTFPCMNSDAFESAVEVNSPAKSAHRQSQSDSEGERDIFHDTESTNSDLFQENDSGENSDFSLLSEQSNGGMAPCPGFNADIAAELAAIPDENTHEDALLTALRKLEGTYQPVVQPIREKSQNMTDSMLFQTAFASANDLAAAEAADEVATVRSLAIGTAPSIISETASHALDESNSTNTLDRSRHAPFILAISAEEAYQQMTLIEKDALEQVDWKVLIEAAWPKRPVPTYSWLHLLATGPPQGIQVVISRFNLVVNWVRSEIILCLTPSLKAQTIMRFIRIAYLSLKGQNMATLMQIVLGLTNRVIERETAAWNLVGKNERRILDRLKEITSVNNNFSRLRAEHRRIDFSKGCIPFTGIYLSDLEHNHQRPSFNDKGEIVFAKFQTAASLVRGFLQCVEWAKNYKLTTNPSVLSKCLYLQSLSQQDFDMLEA